MTHATHLGLALLSVALVPSPARAAPPDARAYPWLAEWEGTLPPLTRLADRFDAPAGFTRVRAAAGSYAAWLRGLPLRTDRAWVQTHRGDPIAAPAAAVVALDVGRGDVQQCADTALRLHAEYLWHAGRADRAVYHFTSGDPSGWRAWRGGERFAVRGREVERVRGRRRANTHRAFRGYLQHLFLYAGTRSLARDSAAVGADEPVRGGDFFVDPGSPGHVVIVLDVAAHADGRRVALLGQGFMPAQELHVLTADAALGGVWFALPAPGETLATPSWQPFAREQLRRFTVGSAR